MVPRAPLLLLALVAGPASARDGEGCPPRPPPQPDWTVAAARVREARPAETAALEAYTFPPGLDEERRDGVRTDGLVVVHRGLVTYERYARGHHVGARHVAWSVTKTLLGLLAGVAVGEGRVALGDSICAHLPDVPPGRCGIKVEHLVEWSSGLDWTESYEGAAYQRSSVLAMLYGEGRRDMAAFVLSHPARAEPGVRWSYSTGDAVALSAVLGAAMEPVHGRNWPHTRLLDRIGMSGATLERDGAGTLVGGSYLWATPRDLARLGLLLLDGGCWGGQHVLPEGWVRDASRPSPALLRGGAPREAGEVAGRSLWLNVPVPGLGQGRPWPNVPEDAVSARGHWGQLVVAIPSLDLVVVRTGDDRQAGALDLDRLVALAIAAGRLP